jgi:hypothetical protein
MQSNGTSWVRAVLAATDIPSLDAAKITTGTLPVARGGTGLATVATGNILLGNGTGNMTALAPGAAGGLMQSNGTSWVRGVLAATDIPSLDTAKITTGTLAYPRLPAGAGTWAVGAGNLLTINGNFTVTGTKAATVQTQDYGKRMLYAVEAPDNRFSDEGTAVTKDGVATITLDPIFMQTIEGEYIVHVTAYGHASLYVDDIQTGSFAVRVQSGAQNVKFAWRLSALRKGFGKIRLEQPQ